MITEKSPDISVQNRSQNQITAEIEILNKIDG